MLLPAVISVMRNEGVDHDELGLNEFHQEVGVRLASLGNQVIFLKGLQLEETVLKGLLKLHFIVSLSCHFNGTVEFIDDNVVPKVVMSILAKVKTFRGNMFSDFFTAPLLENEESENG